MHTLTITGPVSVALKPMSDDEFFEFCQYNDDLRIERTAEGEIVVMPLLGLEAGHRSAGIITQLHQWAECNSHGFCCANSGFILPNNAVRSSNVACISNERVELIPEEELEKFPHMCPDFVIDLLSPSDSLPALKRKMQEWIENGADLAWLIDPFERVVFEYTGAGMRRFNAPDEMAGTGPVEGFRLKMGKIWKPR